MRIGNLIQLQEFTKSNTDKQILHGYLDIYDLLFFKLRDKDINFMEIGVLAGDSLQLWHRYFSKAIIYGLDIFRYWSMGKVKSDMEGFDRVRLHKVNSWEHFENKYFPGFQPEENKISKIKQIISERNKFLNNLGDKKFHIILDDGAHGASANIGTFKIFKEKLHQNGIYVIEDIKLNSIKKLKEYIPRIKFLNMKDRIDVLTKTGIIGLYYEENNTTWNDTYNDILKKFYGNNKLGHKPWELSESQMELEERKNRKRQ